MSMADSIRQSLEQEHEALAQLQAEMRLVQQQKEALSHSSFSTPEKPVGSDDDVGSEELDKLPEMLGELAGTLEAKVVEYIENQKHRVEFLRHVRSLTGADSEEFGGEEGYPGQAELNASLSRYKSMQHWMDRVNSVVDPQPRSRSQSGDDHGEGGEGASEEEDEEDDEEEAGNDTDNGADSDDGAEEAAQGPTFREATPEQQAEMADALEKLQNELQVMAQLQEQLASLEAVEEAQRPAARQEPGRERQLPQVNDDDDDEPPGIAALQQLKEAAGKLARAGSPEAPGADPDEDRGQGREDVEAGEALLAERLRELAELQSMLRALEPGALRGNDALVDIPEEEEDSEPDEAEEKNDHENEKDEHTVAAAAAAEAAANGDVDPAQVAEILELQRQLHSLKQLQHMLEQEGGVEAEPDDEHDHGHSHNHSHSHSHSHGHGHGHDQNCEQEQDHDHHDHTVDEDQGARLQAMLQALASLAGSLPEEDSADHQEQHQQVRSEDDRRPFAAAAAADDGTDSEANFNNMVDQLTPHEAQYLQSKVAEYEEARAEMEAQHAQLEKLRTEYARLKELEAAQQAEAQRLDSIQEGLRHSPIHTGPRDSSSRNNPSPIQVAPPSEHREEHEQHASAGRNGDAGEGQDEEVDEEEAAKAQALKASLLDRLAALQEQHRVMEMEREELVREAQEHKRKEEEARMLQAELLKRAQQRQQEQQPANDDETTDDIGGGVDALDEEDGEFDADQARETVKYLESQYRVLCQQKTQLTSVIDANAGAANAESSEQLAKMRTTLSRIEDLIRNITVYHSFLTEKIEAQPAQ